METECIVLDPLVARHGSITNAQKHGDPFYIAYDRARKDLLNRKASLRAGGVAEYGQEYKNFFLSHCPPFRPGRRDSRD